MGEYQQVATWVGVVPSLSQSTVFSGCNLAFYRLGRLRLEVEARSNAAAGPALDLRRDSAFLPATILRGKVAMDAEGIGASRRV